jgi:hypothetical protein
MWSRGGPAADGVQRPSGVTHGQACVTDRWANSLVSGGFARVGSVGLAGIEPATSPLSGRYAFGAFGLVKQGAAYRGRRTVPHLSHDRRRSLLTAHRDLATRGP